MPATVLTIPIIFCLLILAENNGTASKVMNRTFVILMMRLFFQDIYWKRKDSDSEFLTTSIR